MNFILEGKMKTNGYVHQLNNYEFNFRRQIMFSLKPNGYVELLYFSQFLTLFHRDMPETGAGFGQNLDASTGN